MITTREIVDRLKDIYDRLAAAVSFRWGVVVSTTPPLVRLDADTDPVIVGTIAPLAVGSRVLVLLQNRKNTVIGSAGGDPNVIVIGGTAYQASGTITAIPSTPAFTAFGTVYARTMHLPAPYTPPEGWGFETFVLLSTGHTLVTTTLPQLKNGNIETRHIQIGSNAVTALLTVGWRLTKIV